jgi:glycerate kinase
MINDLLNCFINNLKGLGMPELTAPGDGRWGKETIRVLLAPDKFKGSLSAWEVARHLGLGLTFEGNRTRITCRSLPLADGGDGSVQAAIHAGFRPMEVQVSGPTGVPTTTTVAFGEGTVVVEVATTCGLGLLGTGTLAPLTSNSAGFGEAIQACMKDKPKQLVLALGGSATTDGGAGMLAALGFRFRNNSGQNFVPNGQTLVNIARVEASPEAYLRGVEIVAASDVQNPLLGPEGAAAVYGPQKGAMPADVLILEAGLRNLVSRLDDTGLPATACSITPGAGSAGGLGFAALLLGARIVSGADFFLDLLGFDAAVAETDLVITGEGKMDEQTLSGKLPLVVARRSAPLPVLAVVGDNALPNEVSREVGISRVYALSSMTARDSSTDPELSAQLLVEIGRNIAQASVLGPRSSGIGVPGKPASSAALSCRGDFGQRKTRPPD